MPDKEEDNSNNKKGDAGSSFAVSLKGKVSIMSNVPMPHFNVGESKAYNAKLNSDPDAGLFAIVCAPSALPRIQDAPKYASMINPSAAKLVLEGVVFWPPANEERYVFVYFDNLGKPILGADKKLAMGWKPDDVMSIVVEPMVDVLRDFSDRDFVHGNIRPSNIFGASNDGAVKKIVLGDCLAAPASYMQPVVFESVERAMADPIARGMGTVADDLYAFGITLAVLMRMNDPMAGLSQQEVIREKIEKGSYAAVTGKDRFKGDILELLRGLLHDDPVQRWAIDEVLAWMDGRRLSPKQALIRKRAPRPMDFAGGKYFYLTTLAMALTEQPNEVRKIVEDDSLMQWLKRSIEDEAAIERVERCMLNAREGGVGKGYEFRLASNLSAALDTSAPLRFQRMSMSGNAVGAALAHAFFTKGNVQSFQELLSSTIVFNWLGFHENTMVDINGLFSKYEQCRRFVRSQRAGEGLERCLYLLCPDSFCASEILEGYVVSESAQLALALEDLCQKGKVPALFLDRHSMAFLMQKDSKAIESSLFDLNSGEKYKIILANLKCLADIQQRQRTGALPALAKAFSEKLDCVYDQFHDRRTREQLKGNVNSLVAAGNLQKIAALLDSSDVLTKDIGGFTRASNEFERLRIEASNLEISLEDKDSFGRDRGRECAAAFAGVISFIVVLGALIMFFSTN